MMKVLKIPENDLFRTRSELVEEAYDRQSDRIAWKESEPDSMNASDWSTH